MNPTSGRSSHDQQNYTVDSSEIEAEIVESADDDLTANLFEATKQEIENENSLHGGESMLMPVVRNRSSSNSDAFQDIDPDIMFEHQNSTNGGSQKKIITSTHTPAANIILNLGDRLRTNFRSFVNRRENVYTSHDSGSYPLKSRNKRTTTNPDSFSSLSNNDFAPTTKNCVDTYEVVYDGTQPYTPKKQSELGRSPSVGPNSNSTTNKRPFRIRSSSEARNRRNLYEEKN